jgi:hypothetical protein
MGRIEARLQELGLVLPTPMKPPGNFELVTVHAGVAYVAGHAPIDASTVLVHGAVGADLSLDEGYRAARLTGLSILASLKHALGDLDLVRRWLRAVGYVQGSSGIPRQRQSRERLQRPYGRGLGRRGTTCPFGAGPRALSAQRPDHRGCVRRALGMSDSRELLTRVSASPCRGRMESGSWVTSRESISTQARLVTAMNAITPMRAAAI